MALCVDFAPVLADSTNRRQSYPLSAPVSPIGSACHTPSSGSPRLFASSPRGSIALASSSSSLPALALAAASSPIRAPASPASPATPKAARPPDPETPRKAAPSTSPTTSPNKDLKRSLSLPAVADPDSLSQDFPSPASSFHPPENEAEIIKDLLARDRARRQSEAANRPDEIAKARVSGKKRSTSIGSASPASIQAALTASPERSTRPMVDEEGPVAKLQASRSTSSSGMRQSMPSRPPSDYMSRLDKSAGVIPSTPGLARRLSMSVTRRNSELTIPQRPSSSIAPTLPRVVIRDFGFPSNDPRHTGEGQPVQATPPVRNSSGFWGPPGTRTPTGSGLTSWDELAGADSALVSSASSSTFSWGFITSHAEAEAVDEISESMDEDDAEPADLGLIPEGGALYVATYDFEPEASQEMRLSAGEVVTVFERICEGWVVAGRLRADDAEGEEETGLVPETYLTRHCGDIEDDDA